MSRRAASRDLTRRLHAMQMGICPLCSKPMRKIRNDGDKTLEILAGDIRVYALEIEDLVLRKKSIDDALTYARAKLESTIDQIRNFEKVKQP